MFFNNFDYYAYYKYKDKVDFCSIEQNVEGVLLMKISRRKQLRKCKYLCSLAQSREYMYSSQYISTESK